MNFLLWYNGRDNALSAQISDTDAAYSIAIALKKQNYKVVWTVHCNDLSLCRPQTGYEQAYKEWNELK